MNYNIEHFFHFFGNYIAEFDAWFSVFLVTDWTWKLGFALCSRVPTRVIKVKGIFETHSVDIEKPEYDL